MNLSTTLCEVYEKLKAFGIASSYNAALYSDSEEMLCKTCGSNLVSFDGTYSYTENNKFKNVSCISCGSIFKSKYSVTSSNKRKNLLTSIS